MKRLMALFLLIPSLFPMNLTAQNIGIALSRTNGTVTVFDDSGILGSMAIGGGFPLIGDCAITPDGSTALVTNFVAHSVHVIDITDPTNPALAAGTNPILTAPQAEDISLTPNGQYAAVCGPGVQPIGNDKFVSIIDVAARVEVEAFPTPASRGCEAVEICDDGVSVLALIGDNPNTVRRFTLDGAGQLTDTFEALVLPVEGGNLACAPGSQTGAVVTGWNGSEGATFLIPGLAQVDNPPVPTPGQTVRIHPAGDQIFFRSTNATPQIRAYPYNSVTGIVDQGDLQFAVNVRYDSPWVGIETFEINPDGSTFSVANGISNQVETYSTVDGSQVAVPAPFTVPDSPTGICFRPPFDEDGDGVSNADDVCPGTAIPESVPTNSLHANRFALTDGDEIFDTVTNGSKSPYIYSIQDTAGCSCEQIVDEMGLGKRHTKFGCSNRIMETWLNLVNP